MANFSSNLHHKKSDINKLKHRWIADQHGNKLEIKMFTTPYKSFHIRHVGGVVF